MRQPTPDEVAAVDALQHQLVMVRARLELAVAELRQTCGAPSFARLNESYQWVGASSAPLGPAREPT